MNRLVKPVIYRIDQHDSIVFVNDAWQRFASENDAEQLASGALGKPIWKFISGIEVVQLYREIFAKVRDQRVRITFPFRCDSPTMRREMSMTLTGGDDREIEFRCRTLATQPHKLGADIFGSGDDRDCRSSELLRMCSWCKRVMINDIWVEIESAIGQLSLMSGDALPGLTHGICPRCYAVAKGEL